VESYGCRCRRHQTADPVVDSRRLTLSSTSDVESYGCRCRRHQASRATAAALVDIRRLTLSSAADG
jgi:hypothetical protein